MANQDLLSQIEMLNSKIKPDDDERIRLLEAQLCEKEVEI